MRVFVDADACPTEIRDIIARAAIKRDVDAIFVANKSTSTRAHHRIVHVQVLPGPDQADHYIVANAERGDLVVTQDIPLAAQLVPQGITVIGPRGESYNDDNIADKLSRRDLMQELRDIGEITGGPKPFDDRLKRKFANLFDAALHRLMRQTL